MAILEHQARHGIVRRQLFEHVLRGGNHFALAILHGLGQVHVVEEHDAELLAVS